VTQVAYEYTHPGTALITFDGQEKLNAFSRSTWTELGGSLQRATGDDKIDSLILTGRGRAFVAGADIGEYLDASYESFREFQGLVRRVTDALVSCPKPVIAAVNGYALGGGFELVMACDLVVASNEARFGLPEGKLGLLPGGGGTQRLSRTIGRNRAKELLMTGRLIDASDARRFGLVNRVVEPGDLLSACLGLVEEIRRLAPLAVRTAKGLVDDGLDLSLEEALDLEAARMHPLFLTADAREGIAAFVDKREPRFAGE
jgi:enoyl-CoA hydratase/carnithine racemase